MRALSAGCSVCGGRRNVRLSADVLICRSCDTSDVRVIGDRRRGCPPNMPGAVGGYTVDSTPTTSEEQA